MTVRRKAFLLAGLLSMAAFANAASQNGIRITVLDSVTRSVSLGGNDVPGATIAPGGSLLDD